MEKKSSKMEIIRSSVISECGQYRYQLSREWNPDGKKVMFLMLNPSKADADQDDNTIRRCISFAQSWGYGGLYVGNLFAYRSTDPKQLLQVDDPVGPLNANHLVYLTLNSDMVVAAWGNAGIVSKLRKKFGMEVFFTKWHCLKIGKSGQPCHPLFLKGDLKPIQF